MTEPAGGAKPHTLDDVMIAMDVVDTLRHREDLVRRELNEEDREAELITRLRKIYHDQGIDVPDRVLADGVNALKESRFVYTPPPAGWKRTLLTLWARRDTLGRRGLAAIALLIAAVVGYHLLVTRPARIAEERARIEITQTLPAALNRAHADVVSIALDESAKQKAATLLADGEKFVRDGDRAGASKTLAQLTALRDDLTREYTLMIVSRPGEPTGVWRRPPGIGRARNFYIIVEPVTPDGRKLSLPIRNEETGATETVSKFGVRVPQSTYDAIVEDKRNDGIIQGNRLGVKRRGMLTVDYLMPSQGGFITKW